LSYFAVLHLFTAPSPPYPYTLSLHDALPILTDPIFSKSLISRFKAKAVTSQFTTNGSSEVPSQIKDTGSEVILRRAPEAEIKSYQKNQGLTHSKLTSDLYRSEEHTSELQSRFEIVCRLLLEKKTI